MRIATSTIYTQQATAIDNLQTQYQAQGLNLSTGKSVNAPSDNPTQIGLDLNVRTTIVTDNQQAVNVQAGTAQLTSIDSSLANLTSILQSTRQLAVAGTNPLLTPGDRKNIGDQVDQYLQQTIELANSQYGGAYLFSGTVQSTTPPITTVGSPVSSVVFNGNEQSPAPLLVNGQSLALSPTMQQAFNLNSTNGSPSVFDTLINLRDTLEKGIVTDASTQALNNGGQLIYGGASPAAVRTTLGSTPSPFTTTPTPDSLGNYSISINNVDAAGLSHVNAYTFSGTTVIDDATATSITGQINANTATTGLTATFNAQTQKFVLSNGGGGAFSVTDEPSTGATNTSNFTSAFKLSGSATLPQTVSNQLSDIDNTLNVTLNGRSLVGARINALAQVNTQVNSDVLDNTTVQSGIEDTDVAKTSTQFTATQVALTASYSTTTRLEAKDLFDYL